MTGIDPELGQPESFAFTAENRARADRYIARYPAGRQASAVLALLDLAQRQNDGWLSRAAMEHVAAVLEMPPIRVYEIGTFYSMFNLKPVGKHHIQVCRTTPCWLRGADDLTATCRKKLGIGLKERTVDGMFSLVEVECLGACVNAPMVLIWSDTYEDLTAETFEKVLDGFAKGKPVKPGPQNGRQFSAPIDGPKTLTDASLYATAKTKSK